MDQAPATSLASNYPIIPLSTLVNTVAPQLATLRTELNKKGWAFLQNVFEQFADSQQLFAGLQQYCALPKHFKNSHRSPLFPLNRFGYFETSRKEGFRFIAGPHLDDFSFDSLLLPWKEHSMAVEEFCAKAVQETGPYLFNTTTDKFVSPLIKNGPNGAYGLFDTVMYYPQSQFPKEFEKNPSQVDEHADPGLFSISIGSTAPGLEMYDTPNKIWVPVPPHVFVMWCGYEAQRVSGNQVQPGFHRVRAINQPRMTAWFEVSIDAQVPFNERYDESKHYFDYLKQQSTGEMMAIHPKPTNINSEKITGIPLSKVADYDVFGLPRKPKPTNINSEKITGIPLSKVANYDNLSSSNVNNTDSNNEVPSKCSLN